MTQEERTPSEQARRLVANHELVALSLNTLGATELGVAAAALLSYIGEVEDALRSALVRLDAAERAEKPVAKYEVSVARRVWAPGDTYEVVPEQQVFGIEPGERVRIEIYRAASRPVSEGTPTNG